MRDEAREWLKHAEEDLSAAEDMLATGHMSHCVAQCQQAVEKAIKAVIINESGEQPPRIHSLSRLAELIPLELDDEQRLLVASLSNAYYMLRYPVELALKDAEPDEDATTEILRRTGEVVECLRQLLM